MISLKTLHRLFIKMPALLLILIFSLILLYAVHIRPYPLPPIPWVLLYEYRFAALCLL